MIASTNMTRLWKRLHGYSDVKDAEVANTILSKVQLGEYPISEVAKRLREGTVSVRTWASWIIEESGQRAASIPEDVIAGMSDSEASVRSSCVESLYWLENEWFGPSMKTLIGHFSDVFPISSKAAVVCLRKIKSFKSDELETAFTALADHISYNEDTKEHILLKQVLTQVPSPSALNDLFRKDQQVYLMWLIRVATLRSPLLYEVALGLGSEHLAVATVSGILLNNLLTRVNMEYVAPLAGAFPFQVTVAVNNWANSMIDQFTRLQASMEERLEKLGSLESGGH